MTDIKKVAITQKDSDYIYKFLENAGNSLEGFRYFSKRPVEALENHVCTFLFFQDGIPVCYGHLDNDQGKIWLGVAVIESKKGIGLGTMMMEDLIKAAKDKNIPAIYLTVDTINSQARKLYENLNFSIVKENDTYIEYCLELRR